MIKTAVVLVNLGGPDSPEAIEPFLFNLFNDPAIISLPGLLRYVAARWISWKRAPVAKQIYRHLGGRSPIVSMTEDQATALDKILNENTEGLEFRSFIAMRYWHPMSLEAAERAKEFGPDNVVFLPLYPQYSITTTGSSYLEWKRSTRVVGLDVPTQAICCYPAEPGWIDAQCDLVVETLKTLKNLSDTRLLFSAHGLPRRVINRGDPYQALVEKTAEALAQALEDNGYGSLEWSVCYQSKVGRLEWTGPTTETEILRAARDGMGVAIVPIAFVSEHSETLVELDIEYRRLADSAGVVEYARVPTVGTHDKYIGALAALVREALPRACRGGTMSPKGMERQCSMDRTQCPFSSVLQPE